MRLPIACLALGFLLAGCGVESAATGPSTERDLYEAIARSDVRYALLTRSEQAAEAQRFDGEIVRYTGVEDIDALAAVLAKERVEYHLQEQPVASMRE